ncbi:DNA repair protein RadC [Panacibacter sp. DH6]|uniref:DNA repair protein RadC n=1 Tax=Panacibacter microcysteis TaxID=2793269 RepID=A0A931GYW6_9BACT|nr:DNA repair protein RadC [Panacibacter microcysteis]MBG9377898.1 DNA repair protein RadC [Panacibacter microcysteis]
MQGTSIKHWAEDDRPREKMLMKGTEALSNAELLAIIINNGTKDKSAVDVAKELLAVVQNEIYQLGRLSVKEMVKLKVKGIGEAKAVTIAAALELGIRRETADRKRTTVTHSRDIAEFLRAKLQYKKHEVFAVVFLNRANKIMHYEVISEGGITGTVADPRIILKKTLEHDAVNIILCHNHPSGSIKPSRQDEEITQKIKEAARFLDVKVLDHIIVSEEGYYSFADEGIL